MSVSLNFVIFVCIVSFLCGVFSLVTVILVKKSDCASPEAASLRGRTKGLSIALICVAVCSAFIIYFNFLLFVMVVLSVLCIINAVKLLSYRGRGAGQPYSGGAPVQQYGVVQQQTAQTVNCPNCGAENASGNYSCVRCGKKL